NCARRASAAVPRWPRTARRTSAPTSAPSAPGASRRSSTSARTAAASWFAALGAQQRAREARRAAVALRELVAAVGQHLDAGALHPFARARVALDGQRDAGGERQDVGAHARELLVGHLDELDFALLEQLGEPRREQRGVDDGEIGPERAD